MLITLTGFSQKDTTVYWKRHASVDLASTGPIIGKSNLMSTGNIEMLFGILKKQKTPFIHFSSNSIWITPINLIINKNISDLSVKAGFFLLKTLHFESTISTGYGYLSTEHGYLDFERGSSSSSLRFVYKPVKWFGIVASYYLNLNELQNFHSVRLGIHFSNGL